MKTLEDVLLLDCYGELLTERQKEIAGLYYNEDFEISEIAAMQGISRQAVSDSLKHSGKFLRRMEQKLGMAERLQQVKKNLEQILDSCQNEHWENISTLAENGLQFLMR